MPVYLVHKFTMGIEGFPANSWSCLHIVISHIEKRQTGQPNMKLAYH
jgi:hypothetical protein